MRQVTGGNNRDYDSPVKTPDNRDQALNRPTPADMTSRRIASGLRSCLWIPLNHALSTSDTMSFWQIFLQRLLPRLNRCDETAFLRTLMEGDKEALLPYLNRNMANYRFRDGFIPLTVVTLSDRISASWRLEMLKCLLDGGAIPDGRNQKKQTALMLATGLGEEPYVRLLLKRGASVNAADESGDSPLIWAASTARLASLLPLLEAGADPNWRGANGRTALMYAARNGTVIHIQELLAAGANPDLREHQSLCALQLACERGHKEAALVLAEASPERRTELSLLAAAAVGDIDRVRESSQTQRELTATTESGFTALELTVIYDRQECFEYLLPLYQELQPVRESAFGCAILSKSLVFAAQLLATGVDCNKRDETGETPLMHAMRGDYAEGITWLMNHGADRKLTNNAGDTAQDIGQANNCVEALQALFKFL